MLTAAASSTKKETADDNHVQLEEDEEETRRLDNADASQIPFSMTSGGVERKEKNPMSIEQAGLMQRLLNNAAAFTSDDVVKNIADVWLINGEHRQMLYRYWLTKYAQKLIGKMTPLGQLGCSCDHLPLDSVEITIFLHSRTVVLAQRSVR